MKTGLIDNLGKILKVVRREEPQVTEETVKTASSDYIVKKIYSKSELDRLPGGKSNRDSNPSNETAILLEYIKNISAHSKSSEDKIKSLLAINPEIKRAQSIYVASVMSPNDLQSDLVKIVVDDEGLGPDLKLATEEYLNEFFVKKHKFGKKLASWIGEYTYEKDAKPILILPKSNVSDLTTIWDAIDKGEPLDIYNEDDQITWSSYKDKSLGSEENFIDMVATEAYGIYKPILDASGKMVDKELFRDLTSQTVKVLDKKMLTITSDLGKVAAIKQKFEDTREKKSTDIMKRMYDSYQGIGTNILEISDKADERNTQPIVMEMPSSAVIPLIIPGSKSEHLGYFVVMDEWNNPLNVFDSYKVFEDDDEKLSRGNFHAMFAGSTSSGGLNGIDSPDQRYRITQSIFGIAMKSILRDKVKEDQMVDLPLGEYEALSKFLFHQMLNKNRTTILFVPADLIVYYCDSFKEDGTGQSKTGAIEFVLTLRTTLLVAGIMGAMRAAIDKENIEVTMDDKETNPEQLIEMIRRTIIEKRSLNFGTTNPASISRNMVDAATSITPKNIKGLNFEISRSKDTVASDYRAPEDPLMETINKMYQDNLGVPPSSLNRLSEDEFAKSVSTNNILFSNDIRKVQEIIASNNKKYLSLYLRFSTNNQKELLELYRKHKGTSTEEKSPDEGTLVTGDGKQITDEEKLFLRSVIMNIEAVLPAPNIAITKSQVEDIQAEIEFINTVFENVYNEDILAIEDSEVREFYKYMVATIKADIVKEIMARSSYHKSIEFPEVTSVDAEKMASLVQSVMQKKHGVTNLFNAIKIRLEKANEDAINENTPDEPESETEETY